MMNIDQTARRLLDAAADLDDDNSPASPAELALIAATFAARLFPDEYDEIAPAIHNLLDPLTDAHDESECSICLLAADHMR
jgi:hypothetical protein